MAEITPKSVDQLVVLVGRLEEQRRARDLLEKAMSETERAIAAAAAECGMPIPQSEFSPPLRFVIGGSVVELDTFGDEPSVRILPATTLPVCGQTLEVR